MHSWNFSDNKLFHGNLKMDNIPTYNVGKPHRNIMELKKPEAKAKAIDNTGFHSYEVCQTANLTCEQGFSIPGQ